MMKLAGCLFLVGVVLAGCGSSDKTMRPAKVNIAVMDVDVRSGVQPEEGQSVGDRFITLLRNTGRFNLVDRKQVKQVLLARETRKTGGVIDSVHAEVLPARKMIFIVLGRLGGDAYVVSVKMSDIESSSIDFAVTRNSPGDLRHLKETLLPEIAEELVRALDKESE